MEKTILHRTTIGIVSVIFVMAVILGLLRGEVISEENSQKTKSVNKDNGSLNVPAVKQGAFLFKNKGCIHCHAVDSAQNGIGPSLQGLFKGKEKLANGRPVTDKSVRDQIKTPYMNMPPFADRLNKQEMDQLLLYLITL